MDRVVLSTLRAIKDDIMGRVLAGLVSSWPASPQSALLHHSRSILS